MKPDLPKLKAHADALDALVADNITRFNALIEAQGTIVQYDRAPLREMVLQGLAKSIVRAQELQSALTPYARSVRVYIDQIEKAEIVS